MTNPTDGDLTAGGPVTDRVHETSWSANLETPAHATDRPLVCVQALEAVRHTEPAVYVNLVTAGEHGHPEGSLFGALEAAFGDAISVSHVDQCGCGGHVTRVRVTDPVA